MKYLKTYETYLPVEVKDYVIATSWSMIKDEAEFINNTIGQIDRIIGDDVSIKYDSKLLKKYNIQFANNRIILSKGQIKHVSKNKEDLEIFLNTKKYNL